MNYVQAPEVEELIRMRQTAMRTHTELAWSRYRAQAALIAFDLQRPSQVWELIAVIEQLSSEVAGARDAVEAERAMRRLG